MGRKMKKICLIPLLCVLSGCVVPGETGMYLYDGNKIITGNGGFHYTTITASSVNAYETEVYKHDAVDFYLYGLPNKKTCKLIGYVSANGNSIFAHNYIAKKILQMGGNVGTGSDISMSSDFNDDAQLNESIIASVPKSTANTNIFQSNPNLNTYRYSVFECK